MTLELLALAGLAGFAAGLLDSIVGGGGLILTPAMLNLFPGVGILSLIATQRTSSILGTGVAAWNYLRQVRMPRGIVLAACLGAMPASFVGVQFAKRLDGDVLKAAVLGMCILLALYTFFRRDFGQTENLDPDKWRGRRIAFLAGIATGFYNGLIGPGTGTLMVFAFVGLVGLNFLRASAMAKAANVAADLSSWTVLMFGGYVMWALAAPLVVGNILGSLVGSHLAILKGTRFIRAVFLVVVLALIARLAWTLT